MLLIDQYANVNQLNKVHPGEKLFFSLFTLLIAVASESIGIHFIIFFLMTSVVLYAAKIPWRPYFGMLSIPLIFIMIGILPILINISSSELEQVKSIKILSIYLGVSMKGIRDTLLIISRSMAAVACLYFMALTTPLTDIMEQFKRMKIPMTLIEIMSLIYRFIFVLIDAAVTIYQAQSARLGYSDVKTSFISLGKLISMIFVKAYQNAQALHLSLISRGYHGELKVLSNQYSLNKKNLIIIVLVDILLLMLSFLQGGFGYVR